MHHILSTGSSIHYPPLHWLVLTNPLYQYYRQYYCPNPQCQYYQPAVIDLNMDWFVQCAEDNLQYKRGDGMYIGIRDLTQPMSAHCGRNYLCVVKEVHFIW